MFSYPLFAVRVTDRFHVQQLATEALQEMRIKHRWAALDAENAAIEKARKEDNDSAHIPFQRRYIKTITGQKQICFI